MNDRTIVTYGGGELIVGGGPPVDGLLHFWSRPEGEVGPASYSFILGTIRANVLAVVLRNGLPEKVATFAGEMHVTWPRPRVCELLFFEYGLGAASHTLALVDGQVDALADAIEEAVFGAKVATPEETRDFIAALGEASWFEDVGDLDREAA